MCVCVRETHVLPTYSLVSKVMMMRMGLLFMPPTQLLLHMKLYRMVVNSVPTCSTKKISLKHFMYENDLTKCNLPVEFSGVHNRLALFYFKELCISVGVTN